MDKIIYIGVSLSESGAVAIFYAVLGIYAIYK